MLANPKIEVYLEALCKQVNDDVIRNIMFLDAVKKHAFGTAKLDIPDRHIEERSEQFSNLLKLTDFWK